MKYNPFLTNERNNNLRENILKQHISSIMTDDERANLWGLPEGCRMREGSKIISPENFQCGEYVWIGEGAILDASGGLEIGSHTSIGLNVMIWSHSSFLANLMGNNEIGSKYIIRKKTKIGNKCFIAGPSVVYHGVEIKDSTVVLPMSVVTKDTPGNCIVAGSPAVVIKHIDDDYIEQVLKENNLYS
jgi:acetyltransferase-like isoleucine patch superfamily enzyme